MGTPVQIDNPDKNNTQHPAISGELWQQTTYRPRGPMADIDYDLEPYRTVTGRGRAGGANSKPRDDFETAREAQRATAEREILF